MLRFAFLCVGFLVMAFNNAKALNEVDKMKIYAVLIPTVKECGSQFGVAEEVIKNAQETKNVENFDQCFIACVFKKAGVITDDGKFDVEKSKELISKYLSDSGDQSKAEEFVGKCASVNDQPDGGDGCTRSKLLLDCLMQFKKELEGSR